LTVCVNGIEQPPFEFRPNGASLVERDQRLYLEEAGYEVYTVRPSYPEVPISEGDFHLPSIKLPNAENYRIAKPFDPWTQRGLDAWIRQLQPEMMYLHGPYQVAAKLAVIAKKYGIPYALHVHTHISGYVESRVPEYLWPIAKRFALNRARRLADRASVTIFPSATYEAIFKAETWFNGPSLVFPSFIQPFPILSKRELENANYRLRSGTNLPLNRFLYPGIVVHSRLEKEKNPEYAMQCFAELIKLVIERPIRGIQSPLLIYIGGGTSSCKEHLVWLAQEYGISNLVYFTGARSNEEAKQILQTANQCWFLSDTDTQGIVPLEAGYAGVPVFGLEDQPFDEFFGEKKFLAVPNNKPGVLARRSYALMSDSCKHMEMADHCNSVALKYSDVRKYKKHFLDICQHIVIGTQVI